MIGAVRETECLCALPRLSRSAFREGDVAFEATYRSSCTVPPTRLIRDDGVIAWWHRHSGRCCLWSVGDASQVPAGSGRAQSPQADDDVALRRCTGPE